MNELASKIALGPVLLAQGLYVRRVTVRLPEAAGERSGILGEGSALRLLVTGDSSAAGVGVADQRDALAGQLARCLAAQRRVHWSVVAQSGLDSAGILQLLTQSPAAAHDVAVLCCGVNDVTGSVAAGRTLDNFGRIRDLLFGKFGVRQLLLSPVPPMHLFPALPQPLRWFLGERAHRLNRMLREQAPTWPGCALVDYEVPVESGAIAVDGFHPSGSTYAWWARAIAERVAG